MYVEDLLIIDKNLKRFMEQIQGDFTVKKKSISPPDRYLGADMRNVEDDGTKPFWTMSSNSYFKESGLKYNKNLSDPNSRPKQPFTTASYRPELDTSEECTDDQVTLFQNLIGIL
ncbi:hypothetical protein CTEN210_07236 [Chaetoceros tenuissimus]|uniref:Uncharacterized protein n=1 Tax=Chaetoceros tenuissimus TaxID=426638 RepID=A0AAD3CTT5_9STRA|nr:hypothetical protein CTEN210_07236 [Chaetoceros tenuissimus]